LILLNQVFCNFLDTPKFSHILFYLFRKIQKNKKNVKTKKYIFLGLTTIFPPKSTPPGQNRSNRVDRGKNKFHVILGQNNYFLLKPGPIGSCWLKKKIGV